MIDLLNNNFVVVLLVLFVGVLYWAFKPKRRAVRPTENNEPDPS